jgi:hypothetical protein
VSYYPDRHPAAAHILSHLQNFPLFIQEQNIDRKRHAERVDSLTGDNPKAVAFRQTGMLKQTRAPLAAGIGNFNRIAQQSCSCSVFDPHLTDDTPNTLRFRMLRLG